MDLNKLLKDLALKGSDVSINVDKRTFWLDADEDNTVAVWNEKIGKFKSVDVEEVLEDLLTAMNE